MTLVMSTGMFVDAVMFPFTARIISFLRGPPLCFVVGLACSALRFLITSLRVPYWAFLAAQVSSIHSNEAPLGVREFGKS